MSTIRAGFAAAVAPFFVLAAGTAVPFAGAAQPACKAALARYDAAFGTTGDERAMEAVLALQKECAQPDADRALAVSRLGMVHYARQDVPATIAAFEESVRLAPDNTSLKMSLCGAYMQAARYDESIATCQAGLELAKANDDGTPARHDRVLSLGFNLALAKMKQKPDVCGDRSVLDAFEAYRAAHPDHAWVHQGLGAWAWDCDHDFDKGLALYERSCELGNEAACEQVRYSQSCRCRERLDKTGS
jgi:tetratricopeptide (TPR) repeat protein